MPLLNHYAHQLGNGSVYSFASWPNPSVPAFGAGVYTIWHEDGRFRRPQFRQGSYRIRVTSNDVLPTHNFKEAPLPQIYAIGRYEYV
jgi:hypothetical protein